VRAVARSRRSGRGGSLQKSRTNNSENSTYLQAESHAFGSGTLLPGQSPERTVEMNIAGVTPKPFKWAAKANIILEKNARGRRALEEALSAARS
jgi:hypothetical protein